MTGWGVKGWRRGDTHKHAYGASCTKTKTWFWYWALGATINRGGVFR